jgi:protein disulfide-isomerase
MKKRLILGLALVSSMLLSVSFAQAQTKTWNQDMKKAMAESKSTGKPILIDFSGTDWCSWCMKLDKEVFAQRAFRKYAKKNLVLMLAAFPRRTPLSADLKAQNEDLAKKYNVEGFPTVVLLNSKGETLGVTGYQQGGADNYVKHLQGIIEGTKK